MSFLHDNDDLLFYINQHIDWNTLHAHVEIAKDDPETLSLEDAREFYSDILSLVGTFAEKEIAPHQRALDTEPIELVNGEVVFPPLLDNIFTKLNELGIHGMCLPRELDGLNCPMMVYFLCAELIARADVSVMTHHSFHGGIAMALLVYSMEEGSTRFDMESRRLIETRFGPEIRKIASGEAWGCMDITEPDAGSDMGALRTEAVQDEKGDWFLTGQKIFVTSGHGRYHLVIARTEEARGGGAMAGLNGLSLFLVETYSENEDGSRHRLAHIQRVEEKLGHHASATVTVDFDRTPGRLIGAQGEGFRQMLLLMNNARIAVGFEALGMCEAAWRLARDYAAERCSMGKPIAQHELIADMLDEMQTDIQGIRALAVEAGTRTELFNRKRMELRYLTEPDTPQHEALAREVLEMQGKVRLATPLVKYVASEKAVEMGKRCVQIHGGCGYTTEYGAEKLLRDAMVLPIYEGTSQIQALMATKDNLLAITKNPSAFARSLVSTWRRSHFAFDSVERRVAGIQYKALAAKRALMMRIVRDKWTAARNDADQTTAQAMKDWDPGRDFGPALLHAENLIRILADVAISEALWEQARQWPDRLEVLERYLERAEPRCADLCNRIRTTGDRLLRQLASGQTAETPTVVKSEAA